MREIRQIRLQDDGNQTLSYAWVFDNLTKVFEYRVLELPWLDNQSEESCIALGAYEVSKWEDSPTFGRVFLFDNVLDRKLIEMHPGNYKKDTRGCQLPGNGFRDIDRDGLLDVTASRDTFNILWDLMPNEFKIIIS